MSKPWEGGKPGWNQELTRRAGCFSPACFLFDPWWHALLGPPALSKVACVVDKGVQDCQAEPQTLWRENLSAALPSQA